MGAMELSGGICSCFSRAEGVSHLFGEAPSGSTVAFKGDEKLNIIVEI